MAQFRSPKIRWQSFGEDCPFRRPREYEWLPGGRWLLVRLGGYVYIEDLDARVQESSECLLNLADLGHFFLNSNIWIDPTKCWLSEARIAIYCDPASSRRGTICIFQLNPTGRGLNMKWTTQTITMIKRPFQGSATRLHLEKEYVLATFREMMSSSYRAYLYKYSDGHHRSHTWNCHQHSRTYLLPGGRIGVVTPGHIEISVINLVGSHHLGLQPVLRTRLDPIPGRFRVFKPHSTFRFSYLNLVYEDTLLEIRIPVDANKVYQKQITFTHRSHPEKWGPSLLARMLDGWTVEFMFYELNDSATGQVVSQYCTMKRGVSRRWPRHWDFDVTAGHVMVVEGGEYLLIRI